MTTLLDDAFAHHVWATLRLMDACSQLSDEQLQTSLPGTYGSILDTMRHLVGSDAGYLNRLSGGRHERIEERDLAHNRLQVLSRSENYYIRTVAEAVLENNK